LDFSSLAGNLSTLLIFSKNQRFVLLIFLVFHALALIYFCSVFYNSFLLYVLWKQVKYFPDLKHYDFIMFYFYTYVMYFNITIYHSFLLSFFPYSPLTVSFLETCSLNIYAYMIMLIFVFGSVFHIWENTWDLCLSKPG
jgi:hypothetical protein